MKLLKTIDLKNLPDSERAAYRFRQAARAIIFNPENKLALIHNAKFEYHKLPGGGVEEREDVIAALKRECAEEAGCQIEITGEVGRIIEFRDEYQLHHESFCYTAKASVIGKPDFTAEEMAAGFSMSWVKLAEAIKILENDRPQDYTGKFIVERDLAFLNGFAASVKK